MNAQRLLNRLEEGGFPTIHFCRAAAAVALALLAAAAAVLVGRRMAGALVEPLPPATLLFVACLTLAVAVAVRIGWAYGNESGRFDFRSLKTGRFRGDTRSTAVPSAAVRWPLVAIGTSAAATALLAGVCLPGTSMVCAAVVVAMWIGEESWAWTGPAIRRRIFSRGGDADENRVSSKDGDFLETALAVHEEPSRAAAEAMIPDDVIQQLTRCRTADGTEAISGWAARRCAGPADRRRASFFLSAAGDRARTLGRTDRRAGGPDQDRAVVFLWRPGSM